MPIYKVIVFFLIANVCYAGRTVQFMYFHQPADAPQKAYMIGGGKVPVEVEFPKHNFSPTYEIGAEQRTLYFLSALPEVGKELPKDVPKVNIPAGWQKVLVLAFQDLKNSTLPVKFRAIDASPAKFSNSDTMFINFSPKIVYGMLGSSRVVVKPGATLVAKNAPSDGKDYNVTLWQMNPDKTENYRFLTKVFRHYTDRRKIFFIYLPEGMSEPDYYVTTIQDPLPVAGGS